MTRTRQQLTRDRIRQGFLEESRIKLSGQVSDLFGMSRTRMLRALAQGASDPAEIAALAVPGLHASPEQLAVLQRRLTASAARPARTCGQAASRRGALGRRLCGSWAPPT